MIFIGKTQRYTRYGTYLPECKAVPFDNGTNKMNIGGIGINGNSNTGVRLVGAKVNTVEYLFDNPVLIIDRLNYGVAGIVPNASELVGNAMRTLYQNEFSLIEIPFLFTCGWDEVLIKNYTAHAFDNSSISGHDNSDAYMIYQFRDIYGNWSVNYGSGTYNLVTTTSLAIESDIDPYMRCSLENIEDIEIKSVYTTTPDIILDGVADNPNNLTILLTYVSYLTEDEITQLFYPILQKGAATSCTINKIGNINMSASLKSQLEGLGWTVNI